MVPALIVPMILPVLALSFDTTPLALATQMFAPSKQMPSGPVLALKLPRLAPVLESSLLTLPLPEFATHMPAPSKQIPRGVAPTVKELSAELTPHLSSATCRGLGGGIAPVTLNKPEPSPVNFPDAMMLPAAEMLLEELILPEAVMLFEAITLPAAVRLPIAVRSPPWSTVTSGEKLDGPVICPS